jgi:hypothetical protein
MRKLAFSKRESTNLIEKLQSVSLTEQKQSKRASKIMNATVYQQIKS